MKPLHDMTEPEMHAFAAEQNRLRRENVTAYDARPRTRADRRDAAEERQADIEAGLVCPECGTEARPAFSCAGCGHRWGAQVLTTDADNKIMRNIDHPPFEEQDHLDRSADAYIAALQHIAKRDTAVAATDDDGADAGEDEPPPCYCCNGPSVKREWSRDAEAFVPVCQEHARP